MLSPKQIQQYFDAVMHSMRIFIEYSRDAQWRYKLDPQYLKYCKEAYEMAAYTLIQDCNDMYKECKFKLKGNEVKFTYVYYDKVSDLLMMEYAYLHGGRYMKARIPFHRVRLQGKINDNTEDS